MAHIELTAAGIQARRWTEIRSARIVQTIILVAILIAAVGIPLSGVRLSGVAVSAFLFSHQDIYFAPLVFATCFLAPSACPRGRGQDLFASLDRSGLVATLVLLLVLACWVGHYIVFDGYSLSRDEAMADFDTYVFAHGRLAWPFPDQWRPFADALNQVFILPIGMHDAWVSSYLPVNAAIRAFVGKIADPSLTSPFFVGLGAFSLWRVALRLWPTSPATRVVALVLYAGSAQVLMAGMTSYAMSAHLGLNLLWLWLFLRDDPGSHAGAVLVGFVATGLHQPLFHPLFAAPIVFQMLGGKRRRLLAFYALAYSLIGIFWLSWPGWITNGFTVGTQTHDVGYLTRLIQTVGSFDVRTVWLMALNLLRFLTWQHLLMLPLLILGIMSGGRESLARALAIGFVLPIIVMAIILPAQGHGWGYRYLHGVIGNACLLGAYGWRWLETRGLSLRVAFLCASVVTLIGLPVHAVMARRMAAPYASADARIAAIDADIVIIDDGAAPWGADLVVNRPDLTNRPIRLAAASLRPQDVEGLCRGHTVAFFDEADLNAIKSMFANPLTGGTQLQGQLETAARRAACVIVPLSRSSASSSTMDLAIRPQS